MFADANEQKFTDNFSGVRMAEAPAEPAPEAPKEEEEPKVGEQGDRIMTDLTSGRSSLHGPFRIPPQRGLF